MAKLHKIELYVVDPNRSYEDAVYIFNEISNTLRGGMPVTFTTDTVEVDWFDDIDINKTNATSRDFENYFQGK